MRSLGDTLLVLLLRMLLGEQQPGGLLRLMSDERLMPAVLAVMATPEATVDAGEYGRPRVFITGHLCPSFCPRLST